VLLDAAAAAAAATLAAFSAAFSWLQKGAKDGKQVVVQVAMRLSLQGFEQRRQTMQRQYMTAAGLAPTT
jgi:hypothetical protein